MKKYINILNKLSNDKIYYYQEIRDTHSIVNVDIKTVEDYNSRNDYKYMIKFYKNGRIGYVCENIFWEEDGLVISPNKFDSFDSWLLSLKEMLPKDLLSSNTPKRRLPISKK